MRPGAAVVKKETAKRLSPAEVQVLLPPFSRPSTNH